MKRICFFLITAMLAFCSAGSRGTVTSLDRAMVHAVGIDRDEEGYKLTLQIFRPESKGTDTQLDPAKANIFTVTASAPTVGQAMKECENRLGEFLFIGHDQLTVIGKGVSLTDPERLLSCLYKSKESFLGAEFAWTENASELLTAELSEGAVAAQSIVSIISRHAENSDTCRCDLLTALGAGDKTVIIPRLRLIDTGREKTVSAAGAEVFVNGEDRFSLDPEECCGAAVLRRECTAAVLAYSTGSGPAAVDVKDLCCRRELTKNGDRLSCRLSVRGIIRDDQSIDLLADRESLERECSSELERRCGRIIRLCRERGADLIGLGKLVKSRFPRVWLDCGGDIRRLLEITDISADAEILLKE